MSNSTFAGIAAVSFAWLSIHLASAGILYNNPLVVGMGLACNAASLLNLGACAYLAYKEWERGE